jgi:hypothetical protein
MSLDNCRVCGKRVTDFERGGYEDDNGQRGHFICDSQTGQRIDDLRFVNVLNETYVTWVSELADYGWEGRSGEGWEAVSWTGEIRAFITREDAQAWRVSECLEALGVSA